MKINAKHLQENFSFSHKPLFLQYVFHNFSYLLSATWEMTLFKQVVHDKIIFTF